MSNYTITFDCNYEEQQWWRFAYDNYGLHDPKTHSCLIGCVGQQDHVMENTFQVPAELDGAKVTDFKVTGLSFGLNKNAGQWTGYGHYENNNSTTAIYGVILQLDGDARPANFREISNNSNKFKISESFKETKKSLSSSLSTPLTLTPGKNYKIYLFVPDSGTISGYWWPNSYNTGVLNISCEYTTYTKLENPKAEHWNISGLIKSQFPNKELKTSANNQEYLSYYRLSWGYAGKAAFGYTNLVHGETYYLNPASLSQGSTIWINAQAIHSKDTNYNSDEVKIGEFKVNTKPKNVSVSLESAMVLPKQSPTTIVPIISGEDDDGNALTGYFKINNGPYQSSGEGAIVDKDSKITYYVYDGLENSEEITKEVADIDGITLNVPPTIQPGDSVTYDVSTNSLKIIKNNISCKYWVKIITDGKESSWLETGEDGKTSGTVQLTKENVLSQPFSKLQVQLKIEDVYKDSTTGNVLFISAPTLKSDSTFLEKIGLTHNLGEGWSFDLEWFSIEHSIDNTGITITNPNELVPGATYNFNIIGKYNNNITMWRWSCSSTVKDFVRFQAAPIFGDEIIPWSSSGESLISVGIYNPAGIKIEDIKDFKLVLENGKKKEVNASIFTSNSDTIVFSIPRENFFNTTNPEDFESSFGQLKGKKPVNGYIQYTLNNATISSPQASCVFNFDYLTPLSAGNKSYAKFDFQTPLAENGIPKAIISNYPQTTQDNYVLILYVDRGYGFIEYDRRSVSYEDINNEHLFEHFGEITDGANRKWKIEIQLASNSKVNTSYSDPTEYSVLKHIAPSGFTPNEPNWSTEGDNAIATIKFDINWGTNNINSLTKNAEIVEGDGSIEIDHYSGDLIYTPPKDNNGPYKGISIKFTTTYGETSKTLLVSGISIYRDGPTVSYRQHSVGINTSALQNDAVLTIDSYNNRDRVYFNSTFITQAIIDCGSWGTGTNGEFAPGTIITGGLASVAYTSDIGDLLQTSSSNPVIIITGGNA